ncbi:MAG: sodium:solute symporter [Clostridia bacterium]|nr:sodium:solute symporter [Clostridia bacterium]
MLLKIALVVVFFATMVAVGIICRRRATDVNGFVLGGRNIGPWLTAFAYGTSYFSAVIFIGYSGQFGWKFGLASTWIGIGNAIIGSLLPWIILGRRTRLMTQHFDSNTMPDFFGKRFNSNGLKILAAIIVFIFLIPYTASLYNGLSRLFSMAFNIDYTICIIAMAILTCIYVVAGGYMATAVNDFIQGLIMLVGIVAVVFAVLNQPQAGGFMNAVESLSQISADNIPQGSLTTLLGPDAFNLICVIILTSLGTWGLPQMAHKFYAIKDDKAIIKGTVISTLFALIVAGGCYFIGGFGRLFVAAGEGGNPIGGFDNVVPSMLSGIGDLLLAVVVILVLSASMSTLSSLVLTSSSTLTLDLIKGNMVKNMNEKKQLSIMRILVLVFVAVSAIIAVIQAKGGITFIAQLMGISWGALAGSFLAPYMLGLYSRKITKASVYVNFIFASAVMILNILAKSIFPAWLQSPINCGAFVMIAGFVIVPIVSLFTKKPDADLVNDAFSCVSK